MRITVTIEGPLGATDHLVECDDALAGRELVAALLAHGQGTSALTIPPKDGLAQPASHDGPVGALGLRDGVRIGVDGVDTRDVPVPVEGLQLHVVGGPDAGRVFALPVGVHEVGRSGVISWADASLSRRHLRLEVTADEVRVTDLGSSNGTRMEGTALVPDQAVDWLLGDLVEAGDSLLLLRTGADVRAAVEPAEPGWLNFLRPPRLLPLHVQPTVEVPEAPQRRKPRRIPVVAMVAPLVFGIVMALVWNPMFLMFALLSPIMMGANLVSERRGDAKEHREAVEQYERDLAAAQEALDRAVRSETLRLREELPDPADAFVTAVLPGRRLWERRRHDEDAYALRVGTSDVPSTVKVTGADDGSDHTLHAVPVGVSLAGAGVVGLAGAPAQVDASLRWLVAQLATYHAPRDLAMSFLTGRGGREWSWLRWLPHLRPDAPDACLALVGNDPETVTAQVTMLAAMVKARQQAARESRAAASSFPAHVVVVHGYRELRGTVGLANVLEDGPAVGVYAVCTSDDERSLPESATATLVVDAAQPAYAVLRRSGRATLPRVLLDGVTDAWCDRLARELSPLRDVGATSQGESLPDSARLLDVIGLEPPTADAVRARWRTQPRSTTMTLGVGLQGPFALDLAADGPHGLVAGMTGSGKTELLQTMIASLAVANRPDHLNFVLIDYKGNAAFKDLVHLPHTVGNVTNLDKHLVERALASLNAELKYRQRFLDRAKVKDIEDYQLLQAKEQHRPPLPRLLLVIDEFAQLVKDLPEFVTGLVSIAQLGRSLGIHLVLATQRPSGSVSPEIRANTNMRIALRVADAADSSDVLESPEAARIPKSSPGRGFARLGAGALLAFQAGRIGGRRPGVVATDVAPPFLAPVGWSSLGYRPPQPVRRRAQEEVADTDLAALVGALVEAAAAEDVGTQRSPWLDPLPEQLLWQEVVDGRAVRGVVPPLPYGRGDLPDEQAQETMAFDLDGDGHLLVFGSAKSGRSQVLRTVAASIARLTDPSDVHVYALDCGNGALNPLGALPHCGAVVNRTETERAQRLLGRITTEMDRRQGLLAAEGHSDIREQRRGSREPLPHLVLMLDRWEGFVPTLGENDDILNSVLRILREGASVGVHALVTGDRTMANNSRVVSMTENKLTLRFADRSDYGLVGLPPRQMPERVPPGRGFATGMRESQVALLSEDESGQAQAAVLQSLAEEARLSGSTHVPPFRVDVLPTRASLDLAMELRRPRADEPAVLVGVGGDELTAFEADRRNPAFIVAGPHRSGRSTLLAAAARGFVRTRGQVLAVAPRTGPLRDLAGEDGVLGVVTDPGASSETLEKLLGAATAPVLLVVDDGEVLRESPANDFYQRVARGQVDSVFMLLGGHRDGLCAGFSGWQIDARKSRQGLLLSPQELGDGDLVGTRLSRQIIGRPTQPGLGWLHLGDGRLVQVATLL